MKLYSLVWGISFIFLGCTTNQKSLESMVNDKSCVVTENDVLICNKYEDGRGKGDYLDVQLNCNLRAKPSSHSAVVGHVLRGRRIYTEDAKVMGWYKVYRRKGVA